MTTVYSLNVDDCKEIGTYKNNLIFICSTVFTSPSPSSENITPSPSSENITPSPSVVENAPSPSENIAPSPSVMKNAPSPSVMKNAPSPSVMKNAPSPSVMKNAPSPSVKNIAPESIENTNTFYTSFNTTNNSVGLNTTKNELVKPVESFNIGVIIIPFSFIFLLLIFYYICRKRSSKKICDSSNIKDLPDNDINSDNSGETIPSPPTAPIALPLPPTYDAENPPPVPPRSINVQSITNDIK